jgi:hypothetical protein
MGEHLDRVPVEIQDHIREITRTSGLPDTEDSVELIAEGWLEKKSTFEKQVVDMGMEEIGSLPKGDARGCLAMTLSGSLLNIGPLREGEGRTVQYASIGLRQDVPGTADKEGSELSSDVLVGEPATFSPGPIKSSSPVYKIAAANEDLTAEEQEEQISKATQILTRAFVEINKELEAE